MADSYTFKKLSEVDLIETAQDTANVLIEEDGAIKRVPKTEVGGAGGIKTAIIKSSDYDNTLAGLQTTVAAADPVTFECINMTFEEACQIVASGEPLVGIIMLNNAGTPINLNLGAMYDIAGAQFGVPMIGFSFENITLAQLLSINEFYWTADGISTEQPSSGR